VDADIEGDAWFPDYSVEQWQLVETQAHPADEKNSYPMVFNSYQKNQ